MRISVSRTAFAAVFPGLLEIWPTNGSWDGARLSSLHDLLTEQPDKMRIGSAEDLGEELEIHTGISRDRLEETGNMLLATRFHSTPWRYQHVFDRGPSSSYNVLKIRPGAVIPLALAGVDTTAHVNTVRRMNFRGNPRSLLLNLSVDVSEIPVRLLRETKCFCEYCGKAPSSDESSCTSCGAPLPPC